MNYALSAEGWCKYCHSVDHISDTCPIRPKSMYPRKCAAGTPYPVASKRPPMSSADDTICKKYMMGTVILARIADSTTSVITAKKSTLFLNARNHR